MSVVLGLLFVSEQPQRFYHIVLRIGLPGIDHVVNRRDSAEVWMIRFAVLRRYPDVVSVRKLWALAVMVELAISEVAPEQPEFPEVIGDVFSYVSDGAIGAHDDLSVFVGAVVLS